jgi:hypothetical protein
MPAAEEPAAIRTLARYFFATFWLIVFTGALRKWVAPSVKILYLAQDLPIFGAYLYALWAGLIQRSLLLMGVLFLSCILLTQGFLQIILQQVSPFIALVGFHHYLFYLPMMLIFPVCLNYKYRREFIRWNMLLCLPMCGLAIAQSMFPAAALINKTSEGEAMGLSGSDAVRVSGTFNFTGFYGLWVALAVALCVGEWLLPKEKRAFKSTYLLLACTFASNVCHIISGSRSAILLSFAALVGGALAAFLLGSTRTIATFFSLVLLLPAIVGVTAVIAPHEYQIITERLTGEGYRQEASHRVSEIAIGFITEPPMTLVGAGIGMGIDAAHLGAVGGYQVTYNFSEWDTIRNVYELGTLVGLFYVMTRIFFALGMVGLAVWIVRCGGPPHVLPIAFYCFMQCYLGDLTRFGTMTCSQIMESYAFILGAYLYSNDEADQELAAASDLTRPA